MLPGRREWENIRVIQRDLHRDKRLNKRNIAQLVGFCWVMLRHSVYIVIGRSDDVLFSFDKRGD